ncbi:MAG: UbiA prenyltransferase [Roseibaca calidilacus]|uniref:4-hydroxybenzoate polyprenyltransferase n=1 Tax=Roseibaca calidilacus TaxID=1666912 RepID=A0A0P7YR52_9RHOB|nr:UbiA family prenyltransferase [Roseibaca calidilacus]KPP91597.1 MAG: UbiA prenyltransferase [Roseibaca calidilacus]CUX82850.1 4-hydroxybenzoate polyprenyltransferase [Roseibaca calidilacus]
MTRDDSIEQRHRRQARAANIKDYLRLARFDHSTKHMFILPGIALALLLRGDQGEPLLNIPLGFLAAICAASANYVINEWLDRDFDRHHPEKSERAAVQVSLDIRLVYAWYGTLALAAVALGFAIHGGFGVTILCFLAAGLVYNVPPLRSKDRPYLDVVSESVNNPLRLMLGWAMIDPVTLPPVSVLLSFWFGGAFLMNTKRLAEFRDIVADLGQARLALYRKSFAHYTEARLSVANLTYALLCVMFLAVFVAKYRIEYVLLFPIVVYLCRRGRSRANRKSCFPKFA